MSIEFIPMKQWSTTSYYRLLEVYNIYLTKSRIVSPKKKKKKSRIYFLKKKRVEFTFSFLNFYIISCFGILNNILCISLEMERKHFTINILFPKSKSVKTVVERLNS